MTSSRKTALKQATISSFFKAPQKKEDSVGDAVSKPVTKESLKRSRPVVIDSDDDDLEDALPSSAGPSKAPRGKKQATASASKVMAHGADRQLPRGLPTTSDTSGGNLPTVVDDDCDLDEFEAYFADDSIESESDDEQDEEHIPGPDVEGEECEEVPDDMLAYDQDFRAGTPDLPPHTEADGVNERFEQILRKCLGELVDWAQSLDVKAWRALPREQRCMTRGSWRVLSRTSVDFLMDLFLPSYSLAVQNLVASDSWSLDAILALPDTIMDTRQGIYGNFPTGGPSRPDIGCEAYVGSAQVLDTRCYRGTGHSYVARKYSVEKLTNAHRNSLHYRDICRPSVKNNFRVLCAFPAPVQRGYLYVLESVNMILFGTYNNKGYNSKYASKASFDMVSTVRSSLGLPAVAWRGLNAAWPLFQGLQAASVKEVSPCANKACGAMTYPTKLRPANSPLSGRRLYNPVDPLGRYLCSPCGHFRNRHEDQLPDAAWCIRWAKAWSPEKQAQRVANNRFLFKLRQEQGPLKCEDCPWVESSDRSKGVCRLFEDKLYCSTCWNRRKRNIKARNMIGQDVRCECCNKHRSELPKQFVKNVKGVPVEYPGALTRNKLVGKLLCLYCHKFVQAHKRVKTPAEIAKGIRKRK